MSFNYRVFRESVPGTGQINNVKWSIRETYYNDNNEVVMHSAEPEPIVGWDEDYGDPEANSCGYESLLWQLPAMMLAFSRPVIDLDNVVYGKADWAREPSISFPTPEGLEVYMPLKKIAEEAAYSGLQEVIESVILTVAKNHEILGAEAAEDILNTIKECSDEIQ